jgi:hypothetical protein
VPLLNDTTQAGVSSAIGVASIAAQSLKAVLAAQTVTVTIPSQILAFGALSLTIPAQTVSIVIPAQSATLAVPALTGTVTGTVAASSEQTLQALATSLVPLLKAAGL